MRDPTLSGIKKKPSIRARAAGSRTAAALLRRLERWLDHGDELPWNPAVLEQRIARIHRLGQHRSIDVYNLVAAASIEERIAFLVEGKRRLFQSLFDGDSEEIRFEKSGGFLENVRHIVAPAGASIEADADADGTGEGALDAAVSRADEADDEPVDVEPAPRPAVSELFDSVRIERTQGGGMRIEADPEAAETLAALFEGLAGMLRRARRP